MKPAWIERPEGGGRLALWLIRTFALLAGRSAARLVLYPITAYFLVRRGPERRASRLYLSRALGREATLLDVARHVHAFASVTLDRVFLLTESFRRFEVTVEGREALQRAIDGGRGALLFGSHLGSFDALRLVAKERSEVPVRVVIDLGQNPALSRALNALNPSLAAAVIDARQDGTAVVLAIREALDAGALVAMPADRARPGNTVRHAPFLGAPAPFPEAPWLIASLLQVPVILCFGLYLGGNRYHLAFEPFADAIAPGASRGERRAALEAAIARFAERLGARARATPYNWFNFYDFWHDNRRADAPPSAVADDAPRARAAAATAAARGERSERA